MSEQGMVSCEVILEVSGYMYPGSGLQTGTGGSYFGLNWNWDFFSFETEEKWNAFIDLYHGKIKVIKKSISKKLIITEKSISTYN